MSNHSNSAKGPSDISLFGALVKKRRTEKKWSQEALAGIALSNSDRKGYISDVERAKRPSISSDSIKRIALALDIDLEDIPRSLRWPQTEAESESTNQIVREINKKLDDYFESRSAPIDLLGDLPLEIINREDNSSYFGSRSVELIGRDKEQRLLEEFSCGNESFLWMQVAGDAGQGKSRIALEFAIELKKKGWNSGFLSKETLLSGEVDWINFCPHRPTLIIIDYIVGFENPIGVVLKSLSRNLHLQNRVRLILVERRRWDQADFLLEKAEGEKGVANLSASDSSKSLRSEWFCTMIDRYDGFDQRVLNCVAKPSVVELRGLSSDDLIKIYNEYCTRLGYVRNLAEDTVRNYLRDENALGRPLFVYFLAEATNNSPRIDGFKLGSMLDELLRKDYQSRWNAEFGSSPPTLGDRHPSLELAIAATLSGGLTRDKAHEIGLSNLYDSRSVRKALVLVDAPMRNSVSGPGDFIKPLEPDMLGEWLVLSCIQYGGIYDRDWLSSVWSKYTRNLSNFLLRASQDFAGHPSIPALLDHASQDALSSGFLVDACASITKAFADADMLYEIPAKLFEPLKQAADSGDARAMNNLAFHYRLGINTEIDEALAFTYYSKAAQSGHSIGKHWLGWCYENGFGTPRDPRAAFSIYLEDAEAGDEYAMQKVAAYFFNGLGGIPFDYEKSLFWYQKILDMGHVSVSEKVGLHYRFGLGVKVDLEKAVTLFRRAISAGSYTAVIKLRSAKTLLTGADLDFKELEELYFELANADVLGGIMALAGLYEQKQRIDDAKNWYERATRFGSDAARVRLKALS